MRQKIKEEQGEEKKDGENEANGNIKRKRKRRWSKGVDIQ